MTAISRFFIENFRFTIVLMVFLILAGVASLFQISSEAFPTVNMGQVIIKTVYPGASAEDIESKITKPIEDEIRSVNGLDEVKSVSQPSISTIFTVVDIDNYDANEVVSDLQRAVDRISDLPSDLENPPAFIEIKTEEFPVIELAIVGSNENRLRDRAAIGMEELLEDNKKISSIIRTGYTERQFNINIDPKKLKRYHVGLSEVTRKIQAENLTIPGGSLEDASNRQLIKIDGKRLSAEEIGNIVIRANFTGQKIYLKDIASIKDGAEDPDRLARYKGKPATFLTISKKSGTDLIELSSDVKNAIQKFSDKYEGQLEFHIFNNEGKRVENRLDVLSSNAIAGLVLVIVFLVIFLPGRAGFMAALSLPLASVATFAVMQASGLSLNTITILAMVISIGMLVDNSVVISENFARLHANGLTTKEAILKSIHDLWLPITATAFTTIAAFLPMLVTKGVIGQFIMGIPIVVTIALLLSLVESFIMLPVRLVKSRDAEKEVRADLQDIVDDDNGDNGKDWFTRFLLPPFAAVVRWLIKLRYVTILIFLGVIGVSIYMMAFANKFILFPPGQTEIYIGRVELPQGTKIEVADENLASLSEKVSESFGDSIAHITTKVGISEMQPNDPKSKSGENVGMIYVFMTDEAKNSQLTNEVLEKLRSIPGDNFQSYTWEALINGPPAGDPVAGVFRSNNSEQLAAVAEKMKVALDETPGIIDAAVDDVYGEDEIYVDIDSQKASRLGLDLQSIGLTIRTAMAGLDITDVNLDNREVDFFVRLADSDRQSLDQLKSLKVSNPRGDLISLSQVASFNKVSGSTHGKRFDYKPAKTVTANVNDAIITANEANAVLAKSFESVAEQYPEVTLQFSGEGERIKESMTSLAIALVLAIIGIFALLVFLFRSYVKPLIILTTVPLGLFGVAIAFFVHGRPVSFLALIGVVGLSGIIVNSGIVLISFIDQIRKNSTKPLNEILVEATGLRLRAVVVTSLTTVSGLLPTAYGIGGSDEFIIPMTLAMAWGLVSGTILALLWVPCAYAIIEDVERVVAGVFGSKKSAEVNHAAADGGIGSVARKNRD